MWAVIVFLIVFLAAFGPDIACYRKQEKTDSMVADLHLPEHVKSIYDNVAAKRLEVNGERVNHRNYREYGIDLFYDDVGWSDHRDKERTLVIVIDGYLITYTDCAECIPIENCDYFRPISVERNEVTGHHTVMERDASKNKSVTGGAITGGLLFGGVGAMVGAMSAMDNNIKHSGEMKEKTIFEYGKREHGAISYSYKGEEKNIICNWLYSDKFVDEINTIWQKYKKHS